MRLKALLIIAVAFAGCGICPPIKPAAAHEGVAGYRKGQIHAIEAWARINPVQGRPGALFFTLHNESKVADALVGVTTPIARRTEIHNTTASKDGIMKMVAATSVPVASDDIVVFEPGRYHIMLFDMTAKPKAGSSFPVTLTFAKGKPQTIMVKSMGLVSPPPKPATKDAHAHH